MIRVTATGVDFRIAENVLIGGVIAAGSTISMATTGVTKSATKSGVITARDDRHDNRPLSTADAENRKQRLEIKRSSPFRKDAEWAWQPYSSHRLALDHLCRVLQTGFSYLSTREHSRHLVHSRPIVQRLVWVFVFPWSTCFSTARC